MSPAENLRRKRTPSFDSKQLSLLGAAAKVFAHDGYDKASMRQIALAANVSLAGIYHYCSSKEEMLFHIQLHAFGALLQGLEECTAQVVEPRKRLAAAVKNHVRHFGQNMYALKVCARELEALGGDAHRQVHRLRRSYFEAVHDIVKAIPPRAGAHVDSWLATANLFGMLNWFYQWYDAGRAKVSLDELAAQQVALFLDGYAAPAPKSKRGHA